LIEATESGRMRRDKVTHFKLAILGDVSDRIRIPTWKIESVRDIGFACGPASWKEHEDQ